MKSIISVLCVMTIVSDLSLAQQTQVSWSSISNGFGVATSSNTKIQSLYGQPIVGKQQQGSTSIGSGFFSNPLISEGATLTRVVAAGWNMIGLPNSPYNRYYLYLYPTAIPGTLYGFNNVYYVEDSCDLSEGYWFRSPSATPVPVTGLYVPSVTIAMRSG